jgi:hypothetical protein
MRRFLLLFAAVLLAGLSVSLSAAPIVGTFNIAGAITVTPTTITWVLDTAPFTPNEATIGPGPTLDFAPLAGTTVTIADLDSTTEPVNTPFAAQQFISFDAAPSFPTLDINFIYAGLYSSSGCSTLPAAIGQTCTPPGSPFSFVNNPPGPPLGPQATASWVFTGLTSEGLDWTGNFTSQFSVPYQDVLADLAANGSVTNSFSATFLVTPTVTPGTVLPEPGTLYILGAGLIGLSIRLRRRRA